MLRLNRFVEGRYKNSYGVTIEEKIDITDHMAPTSTVGRVHLELQSIMCHEGDDYESGMLLFVVPPLSIYF